MRKLGAPAGLALAFFLASPASAGKPITLAPLLEEVRPALVCAMAGRNSESALKACFAHLDFGPYRGVRSASDDAAYKDGVFDAASFIFQGAGRSPSEEDWAELTDYVRCIERASYAHPASRSGGIDALTNARSEVKESCLDYRFAISGEPWFSMPELDTDEERMTALASELARRTFATLAVRNGWLARATDVVPAQHSIPRAGD